MPVPTSIDDLSTTAASNSPTGSETPKDGDNYIRALSAFIASLRDKLNGTSDTGTVKAATFSGTHTFSSGNLIHGTYTPTLANAGNISSTTAAVCQWMRVGNTVTVSGRFSATTSGAGATDMTMTLPVASSNFTGTNQAGGTGSIAGILCAIAATTSAQTVNVTWTATSGSTNTCTFSFTYLVV